MVSKALSRSRVLRASRSRRVTTSISSGSSRRSTLPGAPDLPRQPFEPGAQPRGSLRPADAVGGSVHRGGSALVAVAEVAVRPAKEMVVEYAHTRDANGGRP
jgi:hypothetical protein